MGKERPILFSGEMVRAILEGRKTQTRRVMKPQPEVFNGRAGGEWRGWPLAEDGSLMKCPYGVPGDRLWVRETWVPCDCNGMPNCEREFVVYKADGKCFNREGVWIKDCDYEPEAWKPSIHMPRWASRITLEIVNVRVERLQDISEEDAIAEGVELFMEGGSTMFKAYNHKHHGVYSAQKSFETLWESINGPGSWEANPWVWVIEFKKGAPQ